MAANGLGFDEVSSRDYASITNHVVRGIFRPIGPVARDVGSYS